MQTKVLTDYLTGYLRADEFKDYAPNGLQVEGRAEVKKIVLAVSASQSVIDHAVSTGADCILVHHGWFWKGESPQVRMIVSQITVKSLF